MPKDIIRERIAKLNREIECEVYQQSRILWAETLTQARTAYKFIAGTKVLCTQIVRIYTLEVKNKVMQILRNRARCLICHEVVESQHRHDFKRCPCGNLAVDGGREYLKRASRNGEFEELSEVKDDES